MPSPIINHTVLAQLRLHPPLHRFRAELQPQLFVDAVCFLVVDHPALPPEQHVHAAVAVAHPRLADLLDPPGQPGLPGATRPVVVGRRVDLEDPARPPDRHAPLAADPVHQIALPNRLQSFRRMTSCSISRSRLRSATSFFSLAFSSSSGFSRRISVGSRPAYFLFRLKKVAELIPAFRQISATGRPSSACFRMNAFCASVNLLARIASRSFRPGKQRPNSNQKRSSFVGSDHKCCVTRVSASSSTGAT